MPSSELTKRALADGIKKMMQTASLNKISVEDITRFCGISRNTFYYHFKDKFDLVNWIFYTEITPHITKFVDRAHWVDGLTELCLHMQQDKKFYINALNTEGQNSFSECLMDFYRTFLINSIHDLHGDMRLSDREVELIACFYSYALTGIILEWAKHGMAEDPVPTIHLIESLINGSLYHEVKRINDLHMKNDIDAG
ncbi:MAG: dihydroxyacetone kinase transcriptional activator DhaS [Clostridiales bacterium]|nr:dihydroxyacetone kinase transcriptional activator DhaS [Clostridiales bacterium]